MLGTQKEGGAVGATLVTKLNFAASGSYEKTRTCRRLVTSSSHGTEGAGNVTVGEVTVEDAGRMDWCRVLDDVRGGIGHPRP